MGEKVAMNDPQKKIPQETSRKNGSHITSVLYSYVNPGYVDAPVYYTPQFLSWKPAEIQL